MTEPYPSHEQVRQYLGLLFGRCRGGHVVVCNAPGFAGHSFALDDGLDDAAAYIVAKPLNSYVRITTVAEPITEGRGTATDTRQLPALHLDVDVAGPGHKGTALPASLGEALAAVGDFPAPTMVVATGAGAHLYWILDRPIIETQGVGVLARWHAHFAARWQANGWSLDNTSDLARVLRPPSVHLKDGMDQRPVRLADVTGELHDLDALVACLDPWEPPTPRPRRVNAAPVDGASAMALDVIRGGAGRDWAVDRLVERGWSVAAETEDFVDLLRPGCQAHGWPSSARSVRIGGAGDFDSGQVKVFSGSACDGQSPCTTIEAATVHTVADLLAAAVYGDHGAVAAAAAEAGHGIVRANDVDARLMEWARSQAGVALPRPGDAAPAQVGDHAPNYPLDLWERSDLLRDLRDWSAGRLACPDLVLTHLLASMGAWSSVDLWVRGVGGNTALCTYSVGLGASGTGKGRAARAARHLYGRPLDPSFVGPVNPSTGQGIQATLAEETDRDGNVTGQPRQHLLLQSDELSALFGLVEGQQASATLVADLCKAWMTESMGAQNATRELRRNVPAGSYTIGFVSSVQPSLVGGLLDRDGVGFVQRFLWASATWVAGHGVELRPAGDLAVEGLPAVVETATKEVPFSPFDGGQVIEVPTWFLERMHAEQQAIFHGQVEPDPSRSHRNVHLLRTAALVALLHGRSAVGDWDVETAQIIVRSSEAVYDWADAQRRAGEAEEAERKVVGRVLLEGKAAEKVAGGVVQAVAEKVAAHAKNPPEGHGEACTPYCIRGMLRRIKAAGFDRAEQALDEAVERGLVVEVATPEDKATGRPARYFRPAS